MSVVYRVGAGLGNQIMAWPAFCVLRERHDKVHVQHTQGDARSVYTPFIFPNVVGPRDSFDFKKAYTSQHGGKTGGFLEWDGESSEIRMNLRMVGASGDRKRRPWRSPVDLPMVEKSYDVVIAPRSSETRKDYSDWDVVACILNARGLSVATVDASGDPVRGTANMIGVGLPMTISLMARALCVGANDSGLFHAANLVGVPNVVVFNGATSKKKNHDPDFYPDSTALLSPEPEEVAIEMMRIAGCG